MLKQTIIQNLSHAQKNHTQWVKKANKIISKGAMGKEFIPFDATECGLGIWLREEGKKLQHIQKLNKIILKIEYRHNELHNIYLNIYQIFFMLPKQKSFWEKFLNFNSKKESTEVQEAAKLHLEDIQTASNELSALLNQLKLTLEQLNFTQLKPDKPRVSLKKVI